MPNQVLRNFCSFIPFIYYSVFYHADLTLFLIFLSFIIINISAYRNECYRLSQRTPSAYRNERYRLSQRTPSAYRNEHLRLIATNAIAYRNEHLRLIATNTFGLSQRTPSAYRNEHLRLIVADIIADCKTAQISLRRRQLILLLLFIVNAIWLAP